MINTGMQAMQKRQYPQSRPTNRGNQNFGSLTTVVTTPRARRAMPGLQLPEGVFLEVDQMMAP